MAQRVLAHTLDVLLRLLHPMVPFVTEEVWQLLGSQAAPERGLDDAEPAAESIMIAPWPQADAGAAGRRDRSPLCPLPASAGRPARDSQPAEHSAQDADRVFASAATPPTAALLQPMEPYFESMAGARPTAWGPDVEAAGHQRQLRRQRPGDLSSTWPDLIDVGAERKRKEEEKAKLDGLIAAKRKKLENKNFVNRARRPWSRASATV